MWAEKEVQEAIINHNHHGPVSLLNSSTYVERIPVQDPGQTVASPSQEQAKKPVQQFPLQAAMTSSPVPVKQISPSRAKVFRFWSPASSKTLTCRAASIKFSSEVVGCNVVVGTPLGPDVGAPVVGPGPGAGSPVGAEVGSIDGLSLKLGAKLQDGAMEKEGLGVFLELCLLALVDGQPSCDA